MIPKTYYHSCGLSEDELRFADNLSEMSEKKLLATILVQMIHLSEHVAQIEFRLKEPTLFESHQPGLEDSPYKKLIDLLYEINRKLDRIR